MLNSPLIGLKIEANPEPIPLNTNLTPFQITACTAEAKLPISSTAFSSTLGSIDLVISSSSLIFCCSSGFKFFNCSATACFSSGVVSCSNVVTLRVNEVSLDELSALSGRI